MRHPATIQMYRDRASKFRWRLRARNGKIIADCAESYVNKRNLWRAARAVISLLGVPARIVDNC